MTAPTCPLPFHTSADHPSKPAATVTGLHRGALVTICGPCASALGSLFEECSRQTVAELEAERDWAWGK